MQVSKLYVGNLPYATDKAQLETLFSQHGKVVSVTLIAGKGFGFVEMSSPEEAVSAKAALDGTDFGGRAMKIDEARPPKEREHRSGGFGGSRGGRSGFGGNKSERSGGFGGGHSGYRRGAY